MRFMKPILPEAEATRMTMVMIVDEIAEAYGFRNCDGRHEHEERKNNEEGRRKDKEEKER